MKAKNNSSGQALRQSSGQAIVELVVAMVVILVLLAGIIQYCVLGLHHSRAMAEARRLAGVKAMSPASSFESPRFIQACTVGSDGIAYSRDDGTILDDPSRLTAGIVSYAHPTDLDQVKPDNPVSVVARSELPAAMFGLVQGEKTDHVPLLPIVRQLIYSSDEVETLGSAWMTWTTGIY